MHLPNYVQWVYNECLYSVCQVDPCGRVAQDIHEFYKQRSSPCYGDVMQEIPRFANLVFFLTKKCDLLFCF